MPSVDFKEAESAEFQVSVAHTVIYSLYISLYFIVILCIYIYSFTIYFLQLNFIKAGGIHLLQSIFVSNNVIMRTSTNIMRCDAFPN